LGLKGVPYKNEPIIESLGYIFVMILSNRILKEKITKKKLIGNLLILIGIIIYYI
jgi:small multidrug resistance pump